MRWSVGSDADISYAWVLSLAIVFALFTLIFGLFFYYLDSWRLGSMW